MSEEEYMECSVVAYPRQIRFLHINGGAISYYVDRHVSDYVDRLQKENQELKKKYLNAVADHETTTAEKNELERQQKEFIKWLEDYLNLFDNMDIEEQAGYDMLEEILQKYKEIIGDNK